MWWQRSHVGLQQDGDEDAAGKQRALHEHHDDGGDENLRFVSTRTCSIGCSMRSWRRKKNASAITPMMTPPAESAVTP